jgi:hypothetical protein
MRESTQLARRRAPSSWPGRSGRAGRAERDEAPGVLGVTVETRPFTFAELHARASGLDGPTRMAVFYALPAVLQRQAWDDLRERMDWCVQREFEEWDDA